MKPACYVQKPIDDEIDRHRQKRDRRGLRFCFVFLGIAALSFLGVGIQPPTADWGSMVRENATLISYGDITPLLPAAAIALLTVAINFVVDWFLHITSGLRDEQ